MAALWVQQNNNSNKHFHCDQSTINKQMILCYYMAMDTTIGPNCIAVIKNDFTEPTKVL